MVIMICDKHDGHSFERKYRILSIIAEVLLYVAVAILLFLLMGTTFGDDKLKLPEQVKSQPCKLIKIQAETKGKKIVWIIPKEFEADSLDGPRLVGVVNIPGTYRILCITSIEDEPIVAECSLIVEGVAPTPINDQLRKELQDLYTADASPKKAESIAVLAALYRAAIAYANDPEILTADKLADLVRSAVRSKLTSSDLASLRVRIATEVAASLPMDTGAAMTPEVRAKAAQVYTRIATALESIK